ncbi:hypothetical protein GCM10018953_75840 [Streptosporangium nondiastaticum]|uniref:hypothetical protein n=1 Tax=Streptosporangium nondiastaticum TaxID=35764 RepID=UPI0031F869BB
MSHEIPESLPGVLYSSRTARRAPFGSLGYVTAEDIDELVAYVEEAEGRSSETRLDPRKSWRALLDIHREDLGVSA